MKLVTQAPGVDSDEAQAPGVDSEEDSTDKDSQDEELFEKDDDFEQCLSQVKWQYQDLYRNSPSFCIRVYSSSRVFH